MSVLLYPHRLMVHCRQRCTKRLYNFLCFAPPYITIHSETKLTSIQLGPYPTMFTGFVLALIGPLGVTIASQPPNTQQLSPLDSLVLLNGSNAEDAIEISASNDLHIQCDGEKYGSNPNVIDCQDARSYYKRSSQLFTYAERHSGQPASAFPLPVRQMGGKLFDVFISSHGLGVESSSLMDSADGGKCYFEPVLIDKSRIGKSSINQLSDAAYALILQCAVRQSKGGIATGIGT